MSNLADFSMNDLFKMEVESQATILNDGLLALERDPNQPDKFEALMRAAHSVKGAARIVDQTAAVKLAHQMEDVFVAAQKGTLAFVAADIDVLLRGVDLLSRISQSPPDQAEAWMAANGADYDKTLADLEAILSGKSRAAAASSPAPAAPATAVAEPQPAASAPAAAPPAPVPAPTAAPAPAAVQAQTEAPAPEAEPAKPAATAPAAKDAASRVVRVTADRLNRLMGLAGESLVESRRLVPIGSSLLKVKNAQAELSTLLDRLDLALPAQATSEQSRRLLGDARQRLADVRQAVLERLAELENFTRRSDDLSSRLYREVVASQMRPFADGVQGFPRLVRDLARSLGKQVRLDIAGDKTEVDRDILEKLEAPLNHIIRNAIDHGIELPDVRQAAGKKPEGTIRLEARHSAGTLVIAIQDDGRGVDLDRLRKKIVDRGMVGADVVSQLSEPELLDFLFLPGFSTAEKVTEVSGRGVGLDVVASMVHGVGGVIRVTSQLGKGMHFQLQLPITLSVTRAMLVAIAGETYAFPLTRIDRILTVPLSRLRTLEGRQHFDLDGQSIGLVQASQVLELEEQPRSEDRVNVVVLSDRTHRYGLVVDQFLGERDLVVRPLDPRLGKLQDISAAAINEDGNPLLIVDVEDLVRSMDNLLTGGRLRKLSQAAAEQAQAAKRILVVDDSITVREMQRRLLENNGYQVDVAVDGMDGWNTVRAARYDLVISDIDMPRLNGIELVKLIKQDARLAAIPVIIVSYKDREEDRVRGLEAGANCYLTKSSFQDQTLVARVLDLIGEASA